MMLGSPAESATTCVRAANNDESDWKAERTEELFHEAFIECQKVGGSPMSSGAALGREGGGTPLTGGLVLCAGIC